MAEEKETKKTTTSKKEASSKEVKAEKRFCTKCGKELKEGETCTCCANEPAATPAVTVNSDAIVNTIKSVFTTIVNVFKKPDTTITEETTKKDNTISIVIIISLAISFALYLMAMVSNGVEAAADASYGLTTIVTNEISYFKIFIYGVLIYGIMAVIQMFAAFIIAKITKNNSFTFKKAFKLFTTSNAPLVFAYLILAVLLLINVSLLNVLGFIGMAIISLFCFFNYLLGFDKETTIREDRRSWALTSILVVWVALEIIALLLIAGSVGVDTYNKNSSNNHYNYNDSFNW